ncbi:MAG: type 4a pilus biogenesis protein PilO [Armatimonadetes bacterium]|nr:type 4a pilus biogenesis protein PilO [Armatimonadota bacterium]
MNLEGPRLTQALAYFAVVLAFAMLAWHWMSPVPTSAKIIQTKFNEQTKILDETKKVRDQIAERRAVVEKFVWKLPEDQISSKSLDIVTTNALERGLKVVSFRPQRTDNMGSLSAVSALVTLEGPFTNVMAFADSLGTEETRLAVKTIQVNAADEKTGYVTASVGIVAYKETEKSTK